MNCPYCGTSLAEGARLCTVCGKLIAPRQPEQAPGPNPRTPLPGQASETGQDGARPVYQAPPPFASSDPYSRLFDVSTLAPETVEAYRQHQFHATFSVLLAILVHFLTFAAASPFLIARKYALLPKIRPDDFSTLKAAGFMFIPFFNLYWAFVLCQRLVDRLTLQARLWEIPGVPSKGVATSVAVTSCLGAIPYIGVVFVLVQLLVLWPIYLGQVQVFCNRLALAAAPAEARSTMLQLERATRLRWIGWMVITPATLVLAVVLASLVIRPTSPAPDPISAVVFLVAVIAGGATLWSFGCRGTAQFHADLRDTVPWIVAGYLRIDKNAAWSIVWIGVSFAVLFVVAGLVTISQPPPTTPTGSGWEMIAFAVPLAVGAAYAAVRALQLKRQIAWLEAADPPYDADLASP
jgi:hypothetical protein